MEKIRILLADDDKAVRDYLVEGLKRMGYIVQGAVNGKEALEKTVVFKPDLLITDAMMPVMNGFELCRLLRNDAATKDIAILFCTSVPPQELHERGVKADGYIRKPFELEELMSEVQALVKFKTP